MICPRRFWKPTGRVDVPALLAGVVFLGAVVVVSAWMSSAWEGLFPGARLVVPALMVSAPCWTPGGRRMAWFFWWSVAPTRGVEREEQAEVTGSEAERHATGVEDNERELSMRARYVVRLALESGECWDCELPMKRWARLRVGQAVRVAWRGGWVTSIEPAAGPEGGDVWGAPHPTGQ